MVVENDDDDDDDDDGDDDDVRTTTSSKTTTATSLSLARTSYTRTSSSALTKQQPATGEVDLFARFCEAHAEHVARTLSNEEINDDDDDCGDGEDDENNNDASAQHVVRDARCMIYLRGSSEAGRMRLARVAAWPAARASSSSSSSSSSMDGVNDGISFSGDFDALDDDVDDAYGASAIDWDAPEETLASQKTFELPSSNAVVACLCYEDSLSGLIVCERGLTRGEGLTKKQKLSLEASARAFVAAWAIHRNNVVAVAAAYRSEQTVGAYVYESRQPLTALRTLGGMLKTYLKPDDPAGDMAEALVQQGDVLAELSQRLESALYPNLQAEYRGALYGGSMQQKADAFGNGGNSSNRLRISDSSAAASGSVLTDDGESVDFRGVANAVNPKELCDVVPVVVTLLASSDVVATSAGVTVRVNFPEDDSSKDSRAVVHANPKDVRSALAQVIDAALVAAPRSAILDVVVERPYRRGDGVAIDVVVDASESDGVVFAKVNSPSFVIARRLVENAGGMFNLENDSRGERLRVAIRYPSPYDAAVA